jgi:hypothetical protein
MLRRRKRDWFPVVATDLFCGVLAAVIILDAVAPKEASSQGGEALLTITYKRGDPPFRGSVNECSPGSVVFRFRDETKSHSTLDTSAQGSAIDETCRVDAFFSDVNFVDGIKEPLIVVAEFVGKLDEVEITGAGTDKIICSSEKGAECLITQ